MPSDRPPESARAPVVTASMPEQGLQLGLDELGTPLHEVTFVVVDLETTGGRAGTDAITEIGAVKVRGGEVLGEFQTLVDPGGPVPAFITVLTGITTAMLVGAPRIEEVLPSFLEFSTGAVLVAHNAPFDIGFLRAAARDSGHPWPGNQVVDTVRLARRVVPKDEAPNHKLSTLAALFRAEVSPDHRALTDARATVDVLHALLGRLAGLGVTHLEDLATAADPVPSDIRRKRHLADALPDAPGVYLFRGPGDEVLYVGTSQSIRTRVRSYFTAAEKRGRITEMVRIAHAVTPVVCASDLEARVRELRLIAEHSPRYNRRSRFPERMPWLRLMDGATPRLAIVRDVSPGGTHIGPFSSRAAAQQAMDALHAVFLPGVPGTRRSRALAPSSVDAVRTAMSEDPAPVVAAHAEKIGALVAAERFEEAGAVRDRLTAFLRGATRAQRLGPLAACPELVAARRTEAGGWEVLVIRFARLAATAIVPRGLDPQPTIDALRASAEHVAAPIPPCPASHPEEADLLLDWLDSPGVRLVVVDGTARLTCPLRGAQAHVDLASTAKLMQRSGTPLDAPWDASVLDTVAAIGTGTGAA